MSKIIIDNSLIEVREKKLFLKRRLIIFVLTIIPLRLFGKFSFVDIIFPVGHTSVWGKMRRKSGGCTLCNAARDYGTDTKLVVQQVN